MPINFKAIFGKDSAKPGVEVKKSAKAIVESKGKKSTRNIVPVAGIIDGNRIDDIVGHLKNLITIARDARDLHPCWSNYRKSMQDSLLLYVGDHYSVFDTSSLGLPDPTNQYVAENHIFPVVKVMGGIRTANRPGFQWKAPDINDINLINAAADISGSFDIYSQNMGIEEWYPSTVRSALIYGHALARLYHCFGKDASYGKQRYELLDPLAIVFNPDAKEWETAKYRGAVIIEERQKVKAQWENFLGFLGKPRKVEFPNYSGLDMSEAEHWDLRIKEEGSNSLQDSDKIDRGLTYYIEYDDKTRITSKRKESITDESGNLVTTEVDDIDANGNALSTQRKYPNGRLFVIFENDLIYDGENPYEHGNSQFLYLPGIKVDGYLLGMGYPHLLYELQKNLNEAVTQINLNTALMANPPGFFNKDALDEDFVVTNIPGNFIGVSRQDMGSGIDLIKRPIFADNTGQAYNRYVELKTAIYQIVGIEEAVRGISKSGDSGYKVNELYQNATVRFRPDITQGQHYLLKPYATNLMKNMIQFKVNDAMPIGEDYENTLRTVKIYDTLEKFKKQNIELQLKLIVGMATADQRSLKAQEILEYKRMLPNSIPDYAVLIKADDPELVKIGMQMKQMQEMQMQNQMMLQQIIPAAAQMLPKMQEIIATFDEAKDIQAFKEGVMTIAAALKFGMAQQQEQQRGQPQGQLPAPPPPPPPE